MAQPGQQKAQSAGMPQGEKAVVISGSCSIMTNKQVARYRQQASAHAIDVTRCLSQPERTAYAAELSAWVTLVLGNFTIIDGPV